MRVSLLLLLSLAAVVADVGGGAGGGAKLYFRHGAVSSAKTLALLATAHTYEVQGKKVVVLKPDMDVRFGKTTVASRAGLTREADLLVQGDTELPAAAFDECHCVLVDEAQFLSPYIIDQLRDIATLRKVPVICYGLRTDFRSQLFAGSRRLFELADTIEEVKTTCAFCNKKAIYNLKSVDGIATTAGPQVALGAEELYLPTCACHFFEKVGMSSVELGKANIQQDS
jgi:thymidine kinase